MTYAAFGQAVSVSAGAVVGLPGVSTEAQSNVRRDQEAALRQHLGELVSSSAINHIDPARRALIAQAIDNFDGIFPLRRFDPHVVDPRQDYVYTLNATFWPDQRIAALERTTGQPLSAGVVATLRQNGMSAAGELPTVPSLVPAAQRPWVPTPAIQRLFQVAATLVGYVPAQLLVVQGTAVAESDWLATFVDTFAPIRGSGTVTPPSRPIRPLPGGVTFDPSAGGGGGGGAGTSRALMIGVGVVGVIAVGYMLLRKRRR